MEGVFQGVITAAKSPPNEQGRQIGEDSSSTPLVPEPYLKLYSGKGVGAGEPEGFGVAKRGDAPAELVGFLTVGKSTQFGSLAEVYSEVAAGIHSADRCVIRHKGTKIQLLDPSNIVESVKDGKGREAAKSLQWPHCVT
ncbi:unnamed protein product [Rangifer tarandus platyrhynchus]|uniref:Uncharacterized protein n=2 Tax=Rangifer tarandus platyrhynchus TaxID=3082113 RepID=A0ABN8YHT3_RANTA|nr:unnamed protein product [Rangifer tarandus platyrhynchus]CAI9699074.1 unnamed protein product [Rangifer tarandus platyrhynchus]